MSPFKIGFFFFYILMKMVQAFTYAWYGNLIAEEVRDVELFFCIQIEKI